MYVKGYFYKLMHKAISLGSSLTGVASLTEVGETVNLGVGGNGRKLML